MKETEIEKYKRICSWESPYPLNYLAYGNEQEKAMAILIGMMINKRMLNFKG